ncbi:MAG: response regulator [Eubacterium sp.]|nr:response regulator [Eubacterium sp.]
MKRVRRITAYILITACFMACLLGMSGSFVSEAAGDIISPKYNQILYNVNNGLGSNRVNAVLQTKSGYIWIGTDAGLYRYNGNEFRLYNLWNTDRDDVYVINSMHQDDFGRLWVCTKNYGLFYILGRESFHFTNDYYNGVKNILDVCVSPEGTVFVATAYGMYKASTEDMSLSRMDQLVGKKINDLTVYDGKVWGIEGGNTLFSIDSEMNLEEKKSSVFTEDELSCIEASESFLYVGTRGRSIIRLKSFTEYKSFLTGKESINDININDGVIYISADNGIGYFSQSGEYFSLKDALVDSYITDSIVDYEGNLWFASSRLGLMEMSLSKFSDLNKSYSVPEEITNSVFTYNGATYFGTDKGMKILNAKGDIVENELTEMLSDSKVNYITADKKGNIWVCTPRISGLIRYNTKDKTIRSFGSNDGLPSYRINYVTVLKDGSIAVATDAGIAIIGENDVIKRTYKEEDGLAFSTINIIYEANDGVIYAGSEGGGLYAIRDGKVTNYDADQGLNSDNVISIAEGKNCLYLGTDNGLFVMDGSIRQISSVDYSSNIYSIIINGEEVWIVGSKGILRTSEDELLQAGGVTGRYWASGDGLFKTITINSKSYLGTNGILYICCNEGVMTLDTDNIKLNETTPKFAVSSIDVDGTTYFYDQIGGSLTIPKDVNRVTISFALLSYTNHENGKVEYMLRGVDAEPVTINGDQLMQVVYTNLEGGHYTFSIIAENGDGVRGETPVTFEVKKEYGVLENIYFRIALIVVSLMVIGAIALVSIKLRKQLIGKEDELLRLSKEHENAVKTSSARTDFVANMSNDIKIPINSIIRLAENVRSMNPESDEERRSLDSIIESGNKIIELVDESIALAQLESGRAVAKKEPYSVTTLMCDVSDYVVNNLGGSPVRFMVDLGKDIPDILLGDYDKIRNILTILLDNAVKHTKEGSVTLSVDSFPYSDANDKDMVTINFTISDTGVGLAPETLENLFDIQKSENGRMNVSLTVAKKLSELMGGELVADSTYGAGSTFTLSLMEKKGDRKIYSTVESDDVYMMSEAEAEKLMAKEVSALVVDDVDVNRTVAVSILNRFEIKTDVATSGVNSIDMVMNNKYDIVFMDAVMPVMSGSDALKEIRELTGSRYKKLPVIAMSEDATGEDRDGLLAAGFSEVMLKPMDIRHVASILKKYLPSYKLFEKPPVTAKYITETRYWDGLSALGSEIDTAMGLEKIGGSIEVYNKVLTAFYNQNESYPKELPGLFNESLRGFRNRIHNIRNGAINIGAAGLANEATKLESAINIGNRTYVKNNLHAFTVYLKKIVTMVGEYLDFVDKTKGMTDEEYENMLKAEQSRDAENTAISEMAVPLTADTSVEDETVSQPEDNVIPRKYLDSMSSYAAMKDDARLRRRLKELKNHISTADDRDFLEAMTECVRNKDFETVQELITTYISLKY